MTPALPDASTRWRCGGCGNLTRFDVTRTRRTTEFWHFDLAGDHRVEDSTTDHEEVASVTCRSGPSSLRRDPARCRTVSVPGWSGWRLTPWAGCR